MEICLREIDRCQQTGIKPNFIVLLGERYGWRPLPARIEAGEFEKVCDQVADADKRLIDDWYECDDNALPIPREVDSGVLNDRVISESRVRARWVAYDEEWNEWKALPFLMRQRTPNPPRLVESDADLSPSVAMVTQDSPLVVTWRASFVFIGTGTPLASKILVICGQSRDADME